MLQEVGIDMELNKTQVRILEAVERGYTISECGVLYGIKGILKFKLYGKKRYPTFSTNWGGFVFGVPVHLFAAYVFYGENAFEKGVVVRHLNANTLDCSKDNLVLGTPSENELDKPAHIRKRSATIARASQGKRPLNAKLTDEEVIEIREFYNELAGTKAPNGVVKDLCIKYGVSRTVLCKIKNGEYYV